MLVEMIESLAHVRQRSCIQSRNVPVSTARIMMRERERERGRENQADKQNEWRERERERERETHTHTHTHTPRPAGEAIRFLKIQVCYFFHGRLIHMACRIKKGTRMRHTPLFLKLKDYLSAHTYLRNMKSTTHRCFANRKEAGLHQGQKVQEPVPGPVQDALR